MKYKNNLALKLIDRNVIIFQNVFEDILKHNLYLMP